MKYVLNLSEKKLLQAYHMKSMLMREDELANPTEELKADLAKHSEKLKKLGITITVINNKFNIEGH